MSDPQTRGIVEPHHAAPPGTAPFRRHADELDLFAGRHAMAVSRLAWIVLLAGLLAAMANGQALAVWAVDLPLWLGPVRVAIVDGTRHWADAMAAIGADQPYQAVRDAFREFQFWQPR